MKDTVFYTTKSRIFQELLFMLGKMAHGGLVREIEFLKVENGILRSRLPKKTKFSYSERQKILRFGKPLGAAIRRVITITSYQSFRRWLKEENPKPSPKITLRGRPRTKKEIQDMILRMARENAWGYTRILAELKKLNIKSISRNTVKNILKAHGIEPVPERGTDSWDAFSMLALSA